MVNNLLVAIKEKQGRDCSQRRVCHMLSISLNLLDGEVSRVFIEFFSGVRTFSSKFFSLMCGRAVLLSSLQVLGIRNSRQFRYRVLIFFG